MDAMNNMTSKPLYEDRFRKQIDGNSFVRQLTLIDKGVDGFVVALHHEYEQPPERERVVAKNADTQQSFRALDEAVKHRMFLYEATIAAGWVTLQQTQS
jgi:hypothetical protein